MGVKASKRHITKTALQARSNEAILRDKGAKGGAKRPSLKLLAATWPLIAVIIIQAVLATVSIQVVSSMRAYVGGESLWSRAQLQAVYYLERYIDTGDSEVLQRFEAAMAVPLGDRAARLALEADPVDLAAARAGFLAGGNHPDDVGSLIWLFRNFQWAPHLQAAIADWRAAEAALLEIRALAEAIAERDVVNTDPVHRALWRTQLHQLNERIGPLAKKFSETLGEGARQIQLALTLANGLLATLLSGLIAWRTTSFLQHRHNIEQELSWNASHDALTRLPNRRAFEAHLEQVLAAGRGAHAMLFLDLDQFKLVNDTSGHAAGDRLLCRIAETLPRLLRPSDMMARLGGDEFAVLLHDCPPNAAASIAERLRHAAEELDFVWEGKRFSAGASVGLVNIGPGMGLQEVMRAADVACYMAKEKGRNRVQVYAPDDSALAEREGEMGWVQRLHLAMEEDRFRLFAQPIMPASQSDALGDHVEVLIRLQGEDGRMIPPGSFIPAAERFGLMPAIDRWVVRNAFDTVASRMGDDALPELVTCAINLSGATLGDETFLAFVRQEFLRSGVAPSTICFEITETTAIADLAAAAAFIADLQVMGCRFALDDFGVGMSSFSYLKRLPVDYLKIDGSFIRDMLTDRADRAMVEMINHIGHVMGKRTIAECVETTETLEVLRSIGVDCVQGFAVARPAPFLRGARHVVAAPERLRA